jgi:hypothetical protein
VHRIKFSAYTVEKPINAVRLVMTEILQKTLDSIPSDLHDVYFEKMPPAIWKWLVDAFFENKVLLLIAVEFICDPVQQHISLDILQNHQDFDSDTTSIDAKVYIYKESASAALHSTLYC